VQDFDPTNFVILVVDDDVAVRALIAKALERGISSAQKATYLDGDGVNGSPIANRSFEEVNVATSTLTEREKQIVRFIAEDRSSNEIAASLNISLKTVQFHRKAIMAKLGVKETGGLVRYAIRAGLIEPLPGAGS